MPTPRTPQQKSAMERARCTNFVWDFGSRGVIELVESKVFCGAAVQLQSATRALVLAPNGAGLRDQAPEPAQHSEALRACPGAFRAAVSHDERAGMGAGPRGTESVRKTWTSVNLWMREIDDAHRAIITTLKNIEGQATLVSGDGLTRARQHGHIICER